MMHFPLGSHIRIPLSGVRITALDGTVSNASGAATATYTLTGADGSVLGTANSAIAYLSANNFALVIDQSVFSNQIAQTRGKIVAKFSEGGSVGLFDDEVIFTKRGPR